MLHRLLIPALGVLVALVSFALAADPKVYAGDAAHGQRLFESAGCWECHGHVGQGGQGPRLAPSPLPLAAFAAFVRDPKQEMPPYSARVLSAQDLVDIHAYLETIPPPPAGIKLLSSP
jgi:mono/diheme cytochrome c family protein